ncbi:MAG: phosphoglycerate kinase, partial [Chlamydiia bacterium]|nr:phosphoglycerate kinase [Chlamydiia bacterium]
AFGSAHRAHTSTVTLAEYFPNAAAPGLLMAKEMKAFAQVLENPKHPFFALIGGAKISSKIGVLQALSKRVDGMVIIGAMAHTFLKALGISVGASLVEEEFVEEAKAIMQACKERGIFLLLPKDEVAVKEGEIIVVDFSEGGIPEGFQGLDIGPKTVAEIREVVKDAGTLFWNGPAGVFEDERFSKGTEEVGKALAESCAFTIVGGGDSVAALNKLNLAEKMAHISTGGGASIELIEKGTLPGIAILNCKINSR